MEKKIGKRLRDLRESRGLSQEYVADSLGISQATYCKIENNQVRINSDRIYELALMYNISINEFWGVDSTPNQTYDSAITPKSNTVNFTNPYKKEDSLENTKMEEYVRSLKDKIRLLETQIEIINQEKKFKDME
ncbi:MAG: XRE family transcriptional regulator [Sphingobacteriia bacterium]|nr:XRE family transcriptional regulator [Sphingobacteriia bacterium]